MSIQTTFNRSIQGTNNIYGDIQSNDNATFNNVISNNVTSNGTLNYYVNGVNTRTDTSNNITHKVDTIFQNLQSTYQSKAFLSSSGVLQRYPNWTIFTPQQNTNGTLTFSTFQFDTTNFVCHKVRFQGFMSPTNNVNKPHLNIRLLINGSTTGVPDMENTIFYALRGQTQLLQMDHTQISPRCKIFDSIANESGSYYDFNGELVLCSAYGGSPQIQVEAFYIKSQTGPAKVFGATRMWTGLASYDFNGLMFEFTNMSNSPQIIHLRYYVESF